MLCADKNLYLLIIFYLLLTPLLVNTIIAEKTKQKQLSSELELVLDSQAQLSIKM